MKVLEWKHKTITEADLFVELDQDESNELESLFPGFKEACDTLFGYFVFVNSNKKTVTPLRNYSFAFGNQYNGYPPYGQVLDGKVIDFKELSWQPYTEFEMKYNDPVKDNAQKD